MLMMRDLVRCGRSKMLMVGVIWYRVEGVIWYRVEGVLCRIRQMLDKYRLEPVVTSIDDHISNSTRVSSTICLFLAARVDNELEIQYQSS